MIEDLALDIRNLIDESCKENGVSFDDLDDEQKQIFTFGVMCILFKNFMKKINEVTKNE